GPVKAAAFSPRPLSARTLKGGPMFGPGVSGLIVSAAVLLNAPLNPVAVNMLLLKLKIWLFWHTRPASPGEAAAHAPDPPIGRLLPKSRSTAIAGPAPTTKPTTSAASPASLLIKPLVSVFTIMFSPLNMEAMSPSGIGTIKLALPRLIQQSAQVREERNLPRRSSICH